ncbi:MAG: hypothetical protein LVQ97_04440 [Candidatus Micrarchaeales archaeon]|jgi:hypothetical protein|uniref:Uncharacterized protein n=1 Tax=Candidatus Micrarchaeum acidiphilum ARMAN-2 TaxID=425595 RepID=C7DH37_MICA2|nr:MAG: hypothetical protein UNLARM2_0383 [Candidatus Micrarchaeum acidiphilum ARMAN-2]MCW6161405.1 hypothetical protein [Candidatus Micrarchaeales archaeon]
MVTKNAKDFRVDSVFDLYRIPYGSGGKICVPAEFVGITKNTEQNASCTLFIKTKYKHDSGKNVYIFIYNVDGGTAEKTVKEFMEAHHDSALTFARLRVQKRRDLSSRDYPFYFEARLADSELEFLNRDDTFVGKTTLDGFGLRE